LPEKLKDVGIKLGKNYGLNENSDDHVLRKVLVVSFTLSLACC